MLESVVATAVRNQFQPLLEINDDHHDGESLPLGIVTVYVLRIKHIAWQAWQEKRGEVLLYFYFIYVLFFWSFIPKGKRGEVCDRMNLNDERFYI